MSNIYCVLVVSVFLFLPTVEKTAFAMAKVYKPDLSNIVKGTNWKVLGRTASLIDTDRGKGVYLSESEGVGVAWLNDYQFRNGTIEFDVKGRDLLQKSFVGLAFQAVDETNYEVVYFRPFNFKREDMVRRSHAVQYMSLPNYEWKKLRDEFPAKYEKPVKAAPDADSWFHVRVVIKHKKIRVYVNKELSPSLEIEKRTESRKGKIGLWVGENSDGSFADLIISSNY